MIVPLLKMRYKYMVWLQSESDVCASDDKCKPQRGAKYYTCAVRTPTHPYTNWLHHRR
jgi:hypothetical protein